MAYLRDTQDTKKCLHIKYKEEMIMNINPSDIHYKYDTRGYMLYYKDKPLGGAGIDKYAKGCRANLKLFKESAELEKRNLLNGRGRQDMIAIIEKINEEEPTNEN